MSIQKCVSLSRQDFNLGKYAKKKSCFALSINCTDCYCNCLDRSTCNKAQQKVRWLGRGWREVTRKRTKTNEGERGDNAHTNIHPEKEQRKLSTHHEIIDWNPEKLRQWSRKCASNHNYGIIRAAVEFFDFLINVKSLYTLRFIMQIRNLEYYSYQNLRKI